MRTFDTGATRDNDDTKNDYEGFLSPIFLEEFGDYMTRHRHQADGQIRASDNWQKGIPIEAYRKSLIRHALDLWALWRGFTPKRVRKEMPNASQDERFFEAAMGLVFNMQGYVHELKKAEYLAPVVKQDDV